MPQASSQHQPQLGCDGGKGQSAKHQHQQDDMQVCTCKYMGLLTVRCVLDLRYTSSLAGLQDSCRLVRSKVDPEKRDPAAREKCSSLQAESRRLSCHLTSGQMKTACRVQGNVATLHRCWSLMCSILVFCLSCRALSAWISNRSPSLCWYQGTHLQRCMQPQPTMADVRGWRHVLPGWRTACKY